MDEYPKLNEHRELSETQAEFTLTTRKKAAAARKAGEGRETWKNISQTNKGKND